MLGPVLDLLGLTNGRTMCDIYRAMLVACEEVQDDSSAG